MLKYLTLSNAKYGRLVAKNYMGLKDGCLSSRRVMISSQAEACSRESTKSEFQEGSTISGFRVKGIKDVNDLQLTAIRLEHIRTGADYMHVARNDSNNVFSIYFRTPPLNSTGVPHILEHNVLCGSEKYPCRDPFFKMLNRSLSTFMNAMTGNDYTFYPFSTQHPVDFRNLLSIYLDAVFKPKLQELDFLQEGWRLEHENVDETNSPIVLKGVVLNEMKGVFADPQSVFAQKLQNLLLPSDTYGYVSGGDPLHIPDLTWSDLKNFHAHHYHPSNSRIFSYGDQPLKDHLAFINDNYLCKFDRITPKTNVLPEMPWSKPKREDITCNPDPMSSPGQQTTISVSYMLSNINDSFDNFVLSILSELLMGGPNSPFYKSLLEPQIGTGITPSAGFDDSTLDTTFTVGLQGIKHDDIDKVTKIINNTFKTVVTEGFTEDQIEAVLHSIELSLKHQSSNFGLGIAMKISSKWNHGANPLTFFDISENVDKFRTLIKEDPKYLNKLVQKSFIENNHNLTLTMSPSEKHQKAQEEAEKTLLSNHTNSLTQEGKVRIESLGKELSKKQETKDDLSVLPTLFVTDIARDVAKTSCNLTDINMIPVHLYEQPTNGVVYFRSILSTNSVPSNLIPYIPLFANVLTNMGTTRYDFRTMDQKAELVSGGLSGGVHISEDPSSDSKYERGIMLSSHCLSKKFNSMLDLWLSIVNEFSFKDIDRFSTLVKMVATDSLNSMIHQGHKYAITYSASHINFTANLQEQWGGLTYLNLLKSLSESTDISDTLSKIQELAKHILIKPDMKINVNYSPGDCGHCTSNLANFVDKIDSIKGWNESYLSVPHEFTPETCQNHHVFPFPVNFAGKSYPTVPFTHSDSGSLQVLGKLMFHYLHTEIREKGGAYGGGTSVSPGGSFNFFSYRDPHSSRTLKTFESSVNHVLSGHFEQREIDEAKLGVFKALDAPISPGMKGLRHFVSNISDEQYAKLRCSVLDASREDIIRVCDSYLKNNAFEASCLIGPQNDQLEKDTQQTWAVVNH